MCHVGAQLGVHWSRLAPLVRFVECGAGPKVGDTFEVSTQDCGVGNTVHVSNTVAGEKTETPMFKTQYTTTVDHIVTTYIPGSLRPAHAGSPRPVSAIQCSPPVAPTLPAAGSRVLYAKMDTEGFEAQILKGAQEVMRACRISNWVIEIIPRP